MSATLVFVLSLAAFQGSVPQQPTTPHAPSPPPHPVAPRELSAPPEEFAGCWQELAHPQRFLELEPGRLRKLVDGQLSFARVEYDVDHLVHIDWGRRERWDLSFAGEDLEVETPHGTRRLRRVPERPAALDPTPLPLGEASELDPARKTEIVAELARRRETDQAVRTGAGPLDLEKMAQVDKENTAWLRELVGKVGWIDVERFGKDAAGAAFLIVQHSGDLPLMLAALPPIERDVKAHGLDPQNFALLHDRLNVRLGRRQRYGSQLGTDDAGRQIVIALEDPERVEELRKAIGLFPLKQYLELIRGLNDGKPIVFEDDELH